MSKEKNSQAGNNTLLPALDSDKKVSRRKILAAGAAAAVGAAVTAVLPESAKAADGDAVLLGEENTAATTTSIQANQKWGYALVAENTNSGDGIYAVGMRPGKTGLVGVGGKYGVWAQGNRSGVVGSAGHIQDGKYGVEGVVSRESAQRGATAGVIGHVSIVSEGGGGPSDKAVGVMGFSGVSPSQGPNGTGVRGVGSNIGVQAKSSGRALDVKGKAYFSNSGSAFIPAGAFGKTVSGVKLDANAVIMVTLQGSAGSGVTVRYARKKNSSSFIVKLNKRTANKVKFGYFIIN